MRDDKVNIDYIKTPVINIYNSKTDELTMLYMGEDAMIHPNALGWVIKDALEMYPDAEIVIYPNDKRPNPSLKLVN